MYVVWALSYVWYSEKEHSVSETGSYSFVGEKVSPAIRNNFSSRSRLSRHFISFPLGEERDEVSETCCHSQNIGLSTKSRK